MRQKRFLPYFVLSLKRCLRLLPSVLALSALLLVLVFGVGNAVFSANEDANAKLRIGAVGDFENEYLRFGLYALENLDSSRFSLEIFPFENERDAERSLRGGKLHAFIVVPDGFAEAAYEGVILPIRYVGTEGAEGLGVMLANELADEISGLVAGTEGQIFGAQDYLLAAGHEAPYAAGDRLAEEYLGLFLTRKALFDVRVEGVSRGLSFSEYYVCALTTLFFLFWGIACAPVFSRSYSALKRMLRVSGLNAPGQLLAEYLSLAALSLMNFLCIGTVAAAALRIFLPDVSDFSLSFSFGRFLAAALLPLLCFSAMQQFFHELTRGPVSSMLVQFVSALAMGYVCGCFYPSWSLPASLQRLGSALPAGASTELLGSAVTGAGAPGAAAKLLGFSLLFFALSCLARNAVLKKEDGGNGE